jgi:hypothetical protein
MANKASIGFNVDTTEAAALAGFLKTLSLEIKTSRHIGPVLKYTHAVMSDEFTDYMSLISNAQPSRYHHVYEWGQIGDPNAKLWDDVLTGGGNNRVATFRWRASKQLVPVREDFAAVGVKKIHVFVWKAPVMEYAKTVHIEPQRGSFLATFTGPTTPKGKYKMSLIRGGIDVTNPGGKLVKGAFTAAYVNWWSGPQGSATFDSKIRQVLEQDLGKMPIEEVTKKFRKPRTKTIAMTTAGDSRVAEAVGSEAAKKYLAARSARYIEQAKARERIIYG